MFGSYGRGTAAFGGDLGLILVDALARGGQIERLQEWPLADLEQRFNDGSCMATDLKCDLRWLL